jgi:hypothetical protein
MEKKTLQDIWPDLTAGDIVLKQVQRRKDKYDKPELVEYWNVLGHWKTMPNYRELRKAVKDQEPWVEVCS